MSDGRGDALSLLRSWMAAESLIRCDFRLKAFAACFRGRLRVVEDNRVEVVSDDATSELVVPLDGVDVSIRATHTVRR